MHRASLVVVIAIGAAPSAGHAYALRTTSAGDALRWLGGEIPFEIALDDGPPGVDSAQAVGATDMAMTAWRNALDGTGVSMAMNASSGSLVSGDGINSVRWTFDASDPDIEVGLLARTNLSYAVDDGSIEEADIVVNAAEFTWTVTRDGCSRQYDLAATLTHELGHVLGLAHSLDPEATMFATGAPCETIKRDLDGDDQSAVDFLYRELPPPGGVAPDPLTCSAGGGSGPAAALGVLVALAGLSRRRARPLAIIPVAVLAVLGAPARAAQLREVALGELGARSEMVVRGVVHAVEPAPDGELATDSEVDVTECLAGPCPPAVRVRRAGGEQGGRGLWVDGQAELEVGEEVVLYLRARPGQLAAVVGGVQGALRIVQRGATAYAMRDLRGHHLMTDGRWRPGGVELIDLADVRRSVLPAALLSPDATSVDRPGRTR
ncbi:MAG TPA: matrixin family metalloprotease [Kofleriaceae bacterium]|nr:matrixin family metalloprotease [Kofleriaceae bacterium]